MGGVGRLLRIEDDLHGHALDDRDQFPVAFSGGSRKKREPVPALIESTLPV